MTFTILLLIGLIFGAGLIAYIGDVLGRKMGKARLTLMGLRPRHTAVLVTTVTGMVIAALTLALVLAANKNFRKVLTQGPVILAQNIQLQKTNRQLGVQGGQLRGRIERLQTQAAQAEKVYAKARAEMTIARQQLAKAQDQARVAAAQLAASRSAQERLAAQIGQQRRQLGALGADLRSEQLRLAVAQRERQKAQRLAFETGQLAVTALTETGIVRRGYQELRDTAVIYGVGEEISRSEVERVTTLSEARLEVLRALNDASMSAASRGAARGSNERAVVITPIVIQEPGSDRKSRFNESDSIEAIARELLESREPAVAVVLARGNSIKDEQVAVEVKLFRSRPAFSANDVLACETVATSGSAEQLSALVRQFLAGPVRQAAQKGGVVPRSKASGDPAFFDLEVDRLADLVARLRDTGQQVRLCARAAADTTTAGPLELDFTAEKR